MSLYQLIGKLNLTPGTVVDMGPGGHRYGVIQSIVKENYQLPDKCVVTGQIKFYQQPVHLYMIRGMEKAPINKPCNYVWSWTS